MSHSERSEESVFHSLATLCRGTYRHRHIMWQVAQLYQTQE